VTDIEVIGARTHNLKGEDVRIPKDKLVAFTGVSGSGKTSLVIDTVHAEAQLRYLEGLSPFVRQFVTPKDRPQVDRITGLGPTLAVDQRRLNRSGQSTVATLTGIDSYLGLLYSRLPGEPGLTPAHFSTNTPDGMCRACQGSGESTSADPGLVITDPSRPLLAGASPWFSARHSPEQSVLPALAAHYHADLSLPWRDLPEAFRHAVLYGTGGAEIEVSMQARTGNTDWSMQRRQAISGVLAQAQKYYTTGGEKAREKYGAFMRVAACPECEGTGQSQHARTVRVGGLTYTELVRLPIRQVLGWAESLPAGLSGQARAIADVLLPDLVRKLSTLTRLGLSHLQLARSAPSMSGGELQRTRVAAQISTDLTGIVFVLDEPGAGLHPADKANLSETLRNLCGNGNTVLLVEHDPALILTADWVIDVGPGAGTQGGKIVAAGPPRVVEENPDSLTGAYLKRRGLRYQRATTPPAPDTKWLELNDIAVFNVVAERIAIPLNRLTCITGVSGSGKSSLLHHALAAGAEAALEGRTCPAVASVDGIRAHSWVTVVTQEPIGRTPRSTPATYTKAFDAIRTLFAKATSNRMPASAFSFNSDKGRCPDCAGYGRKLIDLKFLPDMWVTCDTCEGRRFTPEVLSVTYRGLAIDELLMLTTDEAVDFFAQGPARLRSILTTLQQVGLGYLPLGQPATELSGGEAQRLRLANAIQRSTSGQGTGLLVLDEPTTGLHPANVEELLATFSAIVEAGNTVVIAEHDLHVAACSDWIVDMGPGAGEDGGKLINQGLPRDVAQGKGPTAEYLRELFG
jgi:excinuclease ABC subunit A